MRIFSDEPDYISNLIHTMDECEIEKTCISGIGSLFHCLDNNAVKQLIEEYPNRFVGAFYICPGLNSPEEIEQAYPDGFKMVKVTLTQKPYDDLSLFPLWETAQQLHMPCTFSYRGCYYSGIRPGRINLFVEYASHAN